MANYFRNLYQKLMTPTDEAIDRSIYGKPQKENLSIPMRERMANVGNVLSNALLGTRANAVDTIGTPQVDAEGNMVINSTVNENPRQGGILRDMAEGYRENRNNAFSLDNLENKNKNFATRIGEGLGSLARFAESPAGRALLVGGIVGATGGDGLQALTYGAQTGMLNQNNRLADQLYRDDLAKQGIDTSNLKGYMNDNAYQNMLRSKQLQDNAAYRQMYYDTMLQNHQDDLEFKKMQAEQQRQEKAADRANQNYWRGQELGLGYAKLNADKQDKLYKEYEKELEKQNEYKDVENQLKAFEGTFKSANNPMRYRVFGGASNALNTLTPQEANFNAQRTLLFNQIARKLGGEKGVLSDADIKRVEAALPSLSDTYEQKQAKMKSIYSLLDIKKGGTGSSQSVGKYKVTVKG